jgi:tyrosine-protein kinase Etk/Wzc
MPAERNQFEAEGDQEINLLELVQVLVKRKMLIIKICSVAIVVSVAYSLILPNIYSATAKILPPQKETGGGLSALLGQAGGLAALAAGGLGGGSDLYIGILKSRSVADAVIQRLDLLKVYKTKSLEKARTSLDGAVKVQAGKDGIISITAEDKDPKRSALLANAFVEELGRTTVRLNLSKAGTERLFLEKRLDLVKKDLKAAEDDLKNFAQVNKIVQVDSQAKASIEGIARMKADLASREVQLSVLRATRTDQSTEVKALETGIQRLRMEILKVSGNSGGGEGIPSVGNVPAVGLEYSRKSRELKTQEAIFEQLTKQYEMAKLNEAKDSSSFQVLDEAVVPVKKSKPKRSLIVIMVTLSAFFVSILIVFVQEYLAKVSDEDKKILENIKTLALTFK